MLNENDSIQLNYLFKLLTGDRPNIDHFHEVGRCHKPGDIVRKHFLHCSYWGKNKLVLAPGKHIMKQVASNKSSVLLRITTIYSVNEN